MVIPHDPNQKRTPSPTLHRQLYAALILLYPRAYRSRFAADMCLAFSERHAEATAGGALSLMWLWLRTVKDVVTLAAAEHAEEMARRFKHAQLMTSARWFVRDVMMGLRMARKQPGLALASIVAIALGIGLTATTFSIVYGTVMRGLPFENANELMHFERENPDGGQSSLAVTPHDFVEWQERQRSFIDLGAYVEATIHLTNPGNAPERYNGVFITPNSFGLLRARAALGRVFLPGEAAAGAPPVVLLSHSLWRTRFGKDSTVVGTDIRVNGDPVTVVGVMPEGFGFPIAESFWLPMRLDLSQYRRGSGRLDVFGRLRPGVSPEDARAEFRTISNQLASTFPENDGIQAVARTFGQEYVGDDFTQRMLLMLAGACLVLLIACFNVANLLLARASSRTREIAVRTAVGATRSRIIAQLLTEVLVLTAMGGALGVALAHGAVSWLAGVWTYVGAFDLPHGPDALFWWRLEIDAIPTLFAGIAIVGAALLAGIAPALQATTADVGVLLRDGSRGSSGRGVGRLSGGLVVAQLAVTTGLLVPAGLMVKSVLRLDILDHGLAADNVLTARIALPNAASGVSEHRYPNAEARLQFWHRLVAQLETAPGVVAATAATALPVTRARAVSFTVPTVGGSAPNEPREARLATVTQDYFETFGVVPLEGRVFLETDGPGGQPVAVVNDSFARRYFANESPLFRQIKIGDRDSHDAWVTVVGVVPDLWMDGTRNREPAGIYVSAAQSAAGSPAERLGRWGFRNGAIAIRVAGDPLAHVTTLRAAVEGVDPEMPMYGLESMARLIENGSAPYKVYGVFYVVFGGTALFLAIVALYGVMAFSVSVRSAEIGIRMALGARAKGIRYLVLRSGLTRVLIGIVLGTGLALWISRGLTRVLFQVQPWDGGVYLSIVLVLAVTALAACLVPALRAAAVNPTDAMRSG